MLKDTENCVQSMPQDSPLISVIIPVFNLEQYIDNCLQSVADQSYLNMEIWVVDDGSTDGSAVICKKWQEKDDRFHYLYKENGGAASARNAALDRCSGDFFVFVDGDDAISEEFVEKLYLQMDSTGADISICTWKNITDLNQVPEEKEELRKKSVGQAVELSKIEGLKRLLYQEDYDTAMWCKLYRKQLFEGLRFTEGNIYEDIDLIYKIFERADKITFFDYPGYFYLLRESGTTLKSFSRKKMDLIDVVEEMHAYLSEKFPEVTKASASKFVRANFHIYLQMPRTVEFAEERKRIEKNIDAWRSTVLKDGRARKGTKVALLLSKLNYAMFYKMKNLKSLGK